MVDQMQTLSPEKRARCPLGLRSRDTPVRGWTLTLRRMLAREVGPIVEDCAWAADAPFGKASTARSTLVQICKLDRDMSG